VPTAWVPPVLQVLQVLRVRPDGRVRVVPAAWVPQAVLRVGRV
jgi:hypothetical protein